MFMKLQSNKLMQRRKGWRHKILRLDRTVKKSEYPKSLTILRMKLQYIASQSSFSSKCRLYSSYICIER